MKRYYCDSFLVDQMLLCHILSDILVEFKKIPSQCSAILWRGIQLHASRAVQLEIFHAALQLTDAHPQDLILVPLVI